jgi:hypothetical protein
MFRVLYAIGAYGRTANIKDWNSEKDFYSLEHERYFSVRDILTLKREGWIVIQFLDIRPNYPVLFSVEL